MEHIEEILHEVEQSLGKLQPIEKQLVLRELLKKYGHAEDAMVVGSNYNFWLNEEDDIYDRI